MFEYCPDFNQYSEWLTKIFHMRDFDTDKLLIQLRLGDEQAYEKIYSRYHKRIYCFAFSYLKSRVLSEDAVQVVFIKLWENRSSISSNIKAFLFTTTRNHVLNMIRNQKGKVLKSIKYEQQKTSSSNQPEYIVLYSQYQAILDKGLEQLSEGKREIFNMKSNLGLTNSEIANELGITIHTVKSQYYQASKFIREYLSRHAGIKTNKAKHS
ncbi:hypothetical protein CWD77_07955 [Rhodohalobacter barkolensis]|uniref:RNA polymerase sigma-70 factor n=2 Tax=Rhodohalobacter barkolensis TaxID=2053187 RepID=A0A2N0VH20_9BACT|nr:hypothetical protein CWD77_07955 [Rhodohalobacter barkolensis]